MKKSVFAPFLLSGVAAFLAACGGTNSQIVTTPPPTITSVSVAAASSTMNAGTTNTVTPTVNGTGSYTDTVNLSIDPSTGGTLSASSGVSSGTALTFTASSAISSITKVVITATSTEDSTKSNTVTVTVNPPVIAPVPTITATPATITLGQSVNVVWSVAGTTTSVSVSGPGLTASSKPTGNVTVTPAALGKADYVITATNAGGTASMTAEVAVNVPPPTATLTPSATSIVSGSSLTLTIATTNATSVTAYSSDNSWSGTVPVNGTVKVTPAPLTSATGSVSYSITAVGSGGSASASSGTITITLGQITVSATKPGVQSCIGECGYVYITLYGTNFIPGEIVDCSPDSNVQYGASQLVNAGEWIVALGIDQSHEGSGNRSCKVCKSDGTGCSAAVQFGLYSSDMCVEDQSSGEKFCLDPQEAIPGQNLYNGVPQNGYVDKFDANGNPDGNFFTGEGRCCIAFDNVTKLVIVDGTPYDENGGEADVPTLLGLYPEPLTANTAGGGFMCLGQPTAAHSVTCISLVGGSSTVQNTAFYANMGTNVQSLATGIASDGDTYVYALAADSKTTLASADVTTGMKSVITQTITGVTASLPGGSSIAIFDSLGLGVITSFGDDVSIPFSETTLKPATAIVLPGTPVTAITDAVDGVVLIGGAASDNSGTFATVNPVTGTTAVIPSKTSLLPTGLVVDPSGGGFQVCPFSLDGTRTACTALTIP